MYIMLNINSINSDSIQHQLPHSDEMLHSGCAHQEWSCKSIIQLKNDTLPLEFGRKISLFPLYYQRKWAR